MKRRLRDAPAAVLKEGGQGLMAHDLLGESRREALRGGAGGRAGRLRRLRRELGVTGRERAEQAQAGHERAVDGAGHDDGRLY